ncbi:hypothetical protein DEO72_LG6g2258 [Vigna unguiculata]|uniref:Uncharacterized protein n=1 Tax=Vigna unguiculata TaxID=3917 RepID=A0A4D6MAX1_VIGUN|nr:hypothetical protein DEO72_LG6g2258 [Vigna unguiculata]
MKNRLVNNETHRCCTPRRHSKSLDQTYESSPEHTHVRIEKLHFLQQLAFPSRWRTPHSVYSLGLSHEFGFGFGSHGQWIVDHGYESEKCGGRVGGGRVGGGSPLTLPWKKN